ncbi:MAG TPA: N-6 DNA methylase [Kofleriaceae bacterium]|nr:N-6 DNA methylase [Kofleriaceae bacterium]
MAKRHVHRAGDWSSVAVRLDEIISAHTGQDPFEEALTLLVARLAYERGGRRGAFINDARGAVTRVDGLVAAAAKRWPGILGTGEPDRRTHLSGAELVRCAAVLDDVSLLADDLVGLDAIFEHITTRVAKGAKGQFFTPRHVIRAIVAMLAPAAGEHIVDPACGSAGFLTHALAACPAAHVHGFDLDPRAVRVARVMLHGRGLATIADSLGTGSGVASTLDRSRISPQRQSTFDLVLTNPPFAGDVGDAYRDRYELARAGRRVERDVLFIERCIELLRPGGRFAIVLPHNKVGGDAWAFVRAWLLERAQVAAVIGLGRNTFQPHTSIKACVVIGVKRARPVSLAAARVEDILFFLSERAGKDVRGRLVRRADGAVDHDLDEAVPLVRRALESAGAAGGAIAEAG